MARSRMLVSRQPRGGAVLVMETLTDLRSFEPLAVRSGLWITEIRDSDLPAYLVHFRDREIHDWTLRIPFPYTARDGEAWLSFARSERDSSWRPLHFALRTLDGLLVGGLGFKLPDEPARHHEAELGYWLAKP